MSIDWTMLVVAVVAFLLAFIIQALMQARIKIASTGIILAMMITKFASDGNTSDSGCHSLIKPS
jgi:uncharacterized membrane protein YqiK